MSLELEYDPSANEANLVVHENGWCLWILRPDGAPGEPCFFTRRMVGDEILDDNLANETILVGYFERKLIELGYSIRRDDAFQMPDDWVARWVLAPGSN